MKFYFLILVQFLLGAAGLKAQNPYGSIGVNKDMLTLSNGTYREVQPNDTLIKVGSVMVSIKSQRLTSLVIYDTSFYEHTLEPEITSRWWSTDTKERKYPNLSPYNYVSNNPIIYIDPNGEDIIISGAHQEELFNMLNDRVGGALIKSVETVNGQTVIRVKVDRSIKVQNSVDNKVSATLYNIIKENTTDPEAIKNDEGRKKQDIYFRTVEGKETVEYDLFSSGEVDMKDMREAPIEMQAAFLGHFIKERFMMPDYENNKQTAKDSKVFDPLHNDAKKSEAKILTEVTGVANMGTRLQDQIKYNEKDDTYTKTYNYDAYEFKYTYKGQPGNIIKQDKKLKMKKNKD